MASIDLLSYPTIKASLSVCYNRNHDMQSKVKSAGEARSKVNRPNIILKGQPRLTHAHNIPTENVVEGCRIIMVLVTGLGLAEISVVGARFVF